MNTELMGSDNAYLESDGLQTPCEESLARIFLKRLNRANSWERRAQVKKDELDGVILLDDSKDDFLPDLLPFKDHPCFVDISEAMKKKILSCGWLAYNEKTVNIEAKIVAPACMHVVYGEAPGLQDWVSRQVACQTLVDEAYHVLLVVRACQITRERRDLLSLTIPEAHLIKKLEEYKEKYREKWQKILIQLATAIVSEIFISDYLKLLSYEISIQPFNRLTVDTHRRDELAHSSTFKELTKSIYIALSKREREFFVDVLPKPVRWFASLELDVWDSMLRQIEFPHTNRVISDCKSINEENLARINYSDLIALAEELGILNVQRGIDSFSREGLME
jgi:hypothetical protein